MNRSWGLWRSVLMSFMLMAVAGCFSGGIGGTGDGDGKTGDAANGVDHGPGPSEVDSENKGYDGLDFLQGTVQSVSPLRVNGYELSIPEFVYDLDEGAEPVPGMYVTVDLSEQRITADALIRGYIQEYDAATKAFKITGRRVVVDARTVLPTEPIANGDQVAVYGLTGAQGEVIATLVVRTSKADVVYDPSPKPEFGAGAAGDAPVALSLEGVVTQSAASYLVVEGWTIDITPLMAGSVPMVQTGDRVVVAFETTGPGQGDALEIRLLPP